MFGLRGGVQLVEKLRNCASAYNAWVTILDDNGKPNNGPFEASRTIITLDPTTLKPKERFDYLLYGQFMKFIRRGGQRIASAGNDKTLAHVAFRNPNGEIMVVVVNNNHADKPVTISWNGSNAVTRLPARAVGTFVWNSTTGSTQGLP